MNWQETQFREKRRIERDALHEELTVALCNILLGEKIPLDIVNAETGEIIVPANRKVTKTLLRKVAGCYDHIDMDPSPIRDKIREILAQFEPRFTKIERNCYIQQTNIYISLTLQYTGDKWKLVEAELN